VIVKESTLWTPAKYTKPLGNEFHSDGPRLIQLVEKYVRLENGNLVRLADYEKSILIRALETYPPGHPLSGVLRYRTFLLSMARRNHKTSLAAYLALYALLQHGAGSSAVIIAPRREQAATAYRYVTTAVNQSDALASRIRPSKSRGVHLRDNTGAVSILTADSDALQGHGVLNGLFILDETHLLHPDIYSAVKASMRSVHNGMILALSTAGDHDSHLYKRLYKDTESAITGGNERMGGIILEGNPDADIDDTASILAANPAIEAGYFSLDIALDEARTEPPSQTRRYLHNNQVEHSSASWVSIDDWRASAGNGLSGTDNLVFAVDLTRGNGYASIAVARKSDKIETELVAAIASPSLAQLKRICDSLRNKRATWVMDTYLLNDLAVYLESKGQQVIKLRREGNVRAAQTAYHLITARKVRSDGNPLVHRQMAIATTKNVDNGFRIVRPKSGADIDACMATVYAIYAAETQQAKEYAVA